MVVVSALQRRVFCAGIRWPVGSFWPRALRALAPAAAVSLPVALIVGSLMVGSFVFRVVPRSCPVAGLSCPCPLSSPLSLWPRVPPGLWLRLRVGLWSSSCRECFRALFHLSDLLPLPPYFALFGFSPVTSFSPLTALPSFLPLSLSIRVVIARFSWSILSAVVMFCLCLTAAQCCQSIRRQGMRAVAAILCA